MKKFKLKNGFWFIIIIVFTGMLYLIDFLDGDAPIQEENTCLVTIDDYMLNEKLRTDSGLICVLFHSPESHYCSKMEQNLNKVKAEKYADKTMYKLNIDDYPHVIPSQNLTGTPVVVLYKEGKEMTRMMGKVSALNIDMILKKQMNEKN